MKIKLLLLFLVLGKLSFSSDFQDNLRDILESDSLTRFRKLECIPGIMLENNEQLTKSERLREAYDVILDYDDPDFTWKWYMAYNLVINDQKNYTLASEQAYNLLDTADHYKMTLGKQTSTSCFMIYTSS